ncbi:MAG: methyltransferase domain-containing protein [Deltaproteobacteria bacterium]|nr:methyltransferase domain-containing protein [Deltaproteobacteria bacterium]
MTRSDHNTEEWYNRYYEKKGCNRNDLLRNPGVLFQYLSHEASIVSAVRAMNLTRELAKVLDVGCGGGGGTEIFMRMGFEPGNIYGIDILEDRVKEAVKKRPNINFQHADASQMLFEDEAFDLVYESTMFVQILDDNLARKIASEMIRVTKRRGYLMLADWRYNRPGNSEYKALSKKRMTKLFDIGTRCQLLKTFKGSLIPPVGRFLSQRIPSVYFLLQALLPALVGQVTYVLQKQ